MWFVVAFFVRILLVCQQRIYTASLVRAAAVTHATCDEGTVLCVWFGLSQLMMSAEHLRPAPQWPVFCFVFLFSFSCSYKIEYFPQGRVTNLPPGAGKPSDW